MTFATGYYHYDALNNASTTRQLLATLSSLLAAPAFTQLVATLFRPILIDLCARWLESENDVEEHLVALCHLLEVHEELFPVLNQLLLKYYENGPLSFVIGTLSPISIDVKRLQRLLLAYYRILQANRALPRHLLWSLEPLSKLIWTPHLDNGVRLLAIRCYSLQSGMGEEERCKIEREVLGEPCGVDCQLNYGQGVDGTEKDVDGWIMPVVELKRVQEERDRIVPLRQLALDVSSHLPTLLTSAPSAGKALLLTHLSALLYPDNRNQIVTIHLADTSLDPRALLGSYVSSTVHPGTFDWKEGVLVRSMREGKWVVFEDIDRGSSEVLGVIKPLVESLGLGKWIGGRAQLNVPGRGTVIAHNDFMLFATRSLLPARNGSFHSPNFFGSHKFSEVIIQSPSIDELRSIVNVKFARLAGGAGEAAINLWNSVVNLGSRVSGRDVGIRELLKFCQRVDNLLPSSYQPMDIDSDHARTARFAEIFPNPSLREDMYLEARDIFFGAGTLTASTRAHLKAVAQVIGDELGLDSDRQQWVLEGKVSEFDVEKDANGRTRLPARSTKVDFSPSPARPFSMHKPAVLLLSRIASAIAHGEPVVSHLASLLHRPLVSLNLSHQTESSDSSEASSQSMPYTRISAARKVCWTFWCNFQQEEKEKFEIEVRKAVDECKWKRAVGKRRMIGPRKRRRTERVEPKSSEHGWTTFLHEVEEFEVQHVHGKGKALNQALRSGDWVLLDEVNLASSETLECISGLLHGPTASITLTEHGSLEPVPRHPDFRLFACMNPATDVGKKDLPPPIRSRFTEIDHYLAIIGHIAVGDRRIIMDVADFYTAVKQVADSRQIVDGANHRPHFSMRTLVRALTFAADTASAYSLRRSVWEGCLMAFTMVLDAASAELVTSLARKHLLSGVRNPRSVLARDPAVPTEGTYIKFGGLPEDYVMTPSVEQKLIDLSRIILTRRFPVLIEGPTSSGKTSSIEYLAKRTGHRFVRINNHEHTDIQEYLGSYISDPSTGKLVFKDGLLVQALRYGHWIVLDELNLAPTDVLEALNRLLDDNRELVVPETHEVVRPHPHFMLFATQNPPGVYGGRKVLSRAFRNRFLEVHFEDVPQTELETILCQRCQIAPSYAKRIVAVFHELQKRRQMGRVFESRQGFATLRDLFRWAGRDAVGYQELADNGYMLLAERTRRAEDKLVVREVIETVMGVRIDEDAMYDLFKPDLDIQTSSVIWTRAMQRLYTLVCRGLKFNEPILLVGETGSGKTSVCQRLLALNCHQNTETADLIGGLRPAEIMRDASLVLKDVGIDVPATIHALVLRLHSIFEWHDGPLIEAMHNGDVFLLDEISLADDSVLERLNSVLEPGRSIVLAERGGTDSKQPAIHASENFKLIATMNPGGDYGKKELSPALRNRFTEIWVPPVDERNDLELIVGSLWRDSSLRRYTSSVLDFVEWLCVRVGDRSLMSLRDILAWIDGILGEELFHHAAHMTYLDGLSSLPQLAGYSRDALDRLKTDALSKLQELMPLMEPLGSTVPLGSFAIDKGGGKRSPSLQSFNFAAPTTLNNAMRVIRGCQVSKPILLEGSPGVGKTSLITALANLSGHELCRINLSDQTDLIDLFGSDLPVEGGSAGEFAWKDAEFLKALQEGHWVLLDEMNLAPQAVLEGLNAILDHRGTVYIPELNRSFKRHPSFRIFAAQNPLHQGGGRKGLPKSFINRFTKVYIDELTPSDLYTVCSHIFPDIEEATLRAMISFNIQLNDRITVQRTFAQDGSPWEFNLRDVIRWGTLCSSSISHRQPQAFLQGVYLHRFRNPQDRRSARAVFNEAFSTSTQNLEDVPPWTISASELQFGHFGTARQNMAPLSRPRRILKMQLSALESLGDCVSQSWLAILTGPRNSGKTDIVRTLADFTGNPLWEVSVNSATDTTDILGSFEQVDARRRLTAILDEMIDLLELDLRSIVGSKVSPTSHNQARALRISCERVSTHNLPNFIEQMTSLISAVVSSGSTSKIRYQEIQSSIETLSSSLSSVGQFEWVDGPLVNAMKSGQWILLDGANLCGASVLDRLNSLCESGGSLTLTERGIVDGKVQLIKPHPNFRLFMSVDPHYGELSRAMRNRGIEIALLSTPLADDLNILRDHYRLPLSYPSSYASMNMQGTIFDAARRGLIDHGYSKAAQHSSTGRCLDQDSALSSLLDQSHRYSGSTILLDFMNEFPTKDLSAALETFRQAYTLHRRLSPAFILPQHQGSLALTDEKIPLKEKDRRVRKAVIDLHKAILEIGLDILKSSSNSVSSLISTKLASRILNFTIYLKKALNSSSYDFSALHAISNGSSTLSKTAPLHSHFMESLPSILRSQKVFPLLDVRTALDEYPSLRGLSIFFTHSQLLHDTMREITALACQTKYASLSRILPYQHLIWALEVGAGQSSLIVRAQTCWLEALWNTQPETPDMAGPSILFHPISLHKAVVTCDMNQVKLLALAQHETILRQQARLTIIQSRQTTDRMSQIAVILCRSLSITGAEFPQSFSNMISLLLCSNDDAFVASIRKEIVPLQTVMSGRTPLQVMGLAWVGISRLLLDLVIPDTPMDPAAVQNSTYHRVQSEEADLSTQIALHQQLEGLLTGNGDNEMTRYLAPRLAEIRLNLAKSPVLPSRTDVPRLHLFWAEVLQFQTNVLSSSKIDGLIDALLHEDENASLRERVTQESLAGFYQRLDTVYPEFADISILLKVAMLYMRFGLRVVVESTSSYLANNPPANLATALLSFPSASSSARLIDSFRDIGPSGTGAFRHILLALGAFSLQKSLGLHTEEHLLSVDMAYEQAIRLWLIDRAKEKKLNEDASTLYRKVDYNSITDAEMEEEEFLAMFPTFEDALENDPTSLHSEKASSSLLVQPEDMTALLHIHYDLNYPELNSPQSVCSKFAEMRSTTIQELITDSLEILPQTLDETGAQFQFFLLRDSILALAGKPTSTRMPYNFYSDPNYGELKNAASVIDALRRRLHVISQEWPDQMVVKHLIERCDSILSINSRSPVAKVIAMVEQLLVQSEDWEMYSNRDNSIKLHQEELVRLVVNWRRLELSCWQSLLDSQAKMFTEELSGWWFRLYDAVVRGSLSATDQESDDNKEALNLYIETLIPLLDDFINSSPLGQFDARMQLIQSFERYLAAIAPSKAPIQRSTLQRVGRVLNASYRYYDLFSDPLRKRLIDEKAALEKEVKGFIKLASWKDVNVQALKQSAQRTHRQLFKIARKFRDVLREPVSGRLQPYLASDAEIKPVHFASSNLSHPTLLASVTLPPGQSAELREKHGKALLVRKRKAWIDMLKELKHAGLASNVKPEVLRQNTSQQWIREQLQLPRVEKCDIEVEKGDTYFVKLCGCLPLLRSSLPTHHSDLTTRELQRGEMFLESGFSMAVDLRSRLATALGIYQQMQGVLDRLKVLSACEQIVRPGLNTLAHITSVKELLSKVSHALSEVCDSANTLNELEADLPPMDTFLDEISAFIVATNNLLGQFGPLLDNLRATVLPYLTQGENDLLLRAEAHLSRTFATLSEWHKNQPRLNHLLSPLRKWLNEQHILPLLPFSGAATLGSTNLELLLNSLLVSVQSLVSRCPEAGYQFARDFTHHLNIDKISTQLNRLLLEISSPVDFRETIGKILPFLVLYQALVRDQLAAHNNWTKSLFKLDFVLCSQGFCKPAEDGNNEVGGEAKDAIGGVGIGEGSGVDNISKEIEDESQVEGLKGDDAESKAPESKNEDGDAIEMNDDFGGALEDMPEPGTDDEAQSDDGSEPEFDETLGDLDDLDLSAVDEKIWGDEKGPENSDDTKEKADEDHSKEQDEGETETENEPEEGEDNECSDPNVSGAKMDEYVPEANTLDLPDEMDLEERRWIKKAERSPMEDEGDDVDMNESNQDSSVPDNTAESQPDDEGEDNVADCSKEQVEDEEKDEDNVPSEEVVARPDLSNEGGMTADEIAKAEADASASTGEAGTSQGGVGNRQALSQSEMHLATNPLRSLGDALKEIRQRFDEIRNSSEDVDAPREQLGELNTQSQIEYLQPEDADHDMQALGSAGDEQVAKLNQLTILDEMDLADTSMAVDMDTPLAPEKHEEPVRQLPPHGEDVNGAERREDTEGAILQSALRQREDSAAEFGPSEGRNGDEMMEEESQDVELQLREWRAADYPEDRAERIWRLYESLTHDLAYTLCEQLRLILEPTMATRLKGDYRTGKRLNMKKVIPYIASDYTKDKIWLRRTKPSQREYQVLISIDDSRSMAESHSVHLAYQTLALISKALSRLESGDVAIAKFGETVDLLHGFDGGPFSDQAGTKVINAFRFSQKATNVLDLLETSLKVLERARERKAMSSTSAADLWQLQIIISDGMCQDHEKLRTILRKAEEQRVMIPGSSGNVNHGSILHMDKAEFKTVDGKMELQLQKYLDSFPFEYYVVLRQVEALPEVLAGTLKQFFERISEE
ncbi:hypothetical protein BDZ97DRAFT_1903538 [Flammula alnicola]|nr:hypothetical protein BDZ97DRAFT_1903538 [Flammula alnicola]